MCQREMVAFRIQAEERHARKMVAHLECSNDMTSLMHGRSRYARFLVGEPLGEQGNQNVYFSMTLWSVTSLMV